jgi:LPXTG-motif cell wall-anchored protein
MAGGAAVAIAIAMTAGGAASSASAADLYVDSLEAEGSSYPTGWFTGTITNGVEGPHAFTESGLEVTGKKQILNGTAPTNDLTDLAEGVFTTWQGGNWFFQLPVFGNPAGPQLQYTTLVPVAPLTTVGDYRTTGPIYAPNGVDVVYAADAVASLQAFETALAAADGYQVLAYGYFWDTGVTGTLQTSSFLTDTTHFVLAPPIGEEEPPTAAPILPATGRDATAALLVGGAAVLLGVALVMVLRRRATSS